MRIVDREKGRIAGRWKWGIAGREIVDTADSEKKAQRQ
jgi:hypothetical protein